MSKIGMFGRSRKANIAFLLYWVFLLSIDVYYFATHLHTMSLSDQIIAGAFFLSAMIWIKLSVDTLRAGVQP